MVEGSSAAHPSKKHVVLDGRHLSTVPIQGADATERCGVFWLVERTLERDEANLILETPVIDMPTTVKWSGMKEAKDVDLNVMKFCVPPVLINPKAVREQTRLVAYDDGSLEQALKQLESSKKEKEEHVQKKQNTSK